MIDLIKRRFEWSDRISNTHDIVVIPCNNQVINGKLVMGAGFALSVKQRYIGIDSKFAEQIRDIWFVSGNNPKLDYYLAYLQEYSLIAFQTKRYFGDPTPPELLALSYNRLDAFIHAFPLYRYHIPLPGEGLGGMSFSDAISFVPENWHFLDTSIKIYSDKAGK